MDGVIIDSEPLWRESIIFTFNKIGLNFTEDMCRITQGMRLHEVVAYWHSKSPWQGLSTEEVHDALLKKVTDLIIEKGIALEGVKESIHHFKSKGYKIGLASSSALSLINTVLNKLNIKDDFDVINSAEYLNYGKPHPEIFIKTAKEIQTAPIDCLVIEDSFNGVLAAKSALMKVIAIPEEELYDDPRFSIADYKLTSLSQINKIAIE